MTSNVEQLNTETTARISGGSVVDDGADNPEQVKKSLLERAGEADPDLAELLGTYYRHVPAEEIVNDEPAALAATLRSHRELATQRVAGRAVVRVFNPGPDDAEWQSSATIVQIVTDDMPYLVDSVTAQLGRHGAEVRRVKIGRA